MSLSSVLRKLMPLSAKKTILSYLGREFNLNLSSQVPGLENATVPVAGKPGTPNLWWHELEKIANKKIFPDLTPAAKKACADIRRVYAPLLEQYEIDADNFFWGSIKNEEAESLYQMILDRKPENVYQIGTFVGYSAIIIAHALKANGGGRLIAVDPEIPHRTFTNPVNVAREAAIVMGLEPYIVFVPGWHSAPMGDYIGLKLKRSIPVVGRDVLEGLPHKEIDFAFIDGDHSSSCTLTDFMLLKDYLSLNAVVLFHDVFSWPTVAQALFMLWHDIHYYVRGTPAYFSLDVRQGEDGLAVLERIAEEKFPTLCIKLLNQEGASVSGAKVELSDVGFIAKSDEDGAVYQLAEVCEGMRLKVCHPDYDNYDKPLNIGTNGDYLEVCVILTR